MKLASTLVCHGCGHSVPPDEPYPFRCPQAELDDDIDHVLRRTLDTSALESAGELSATQAKQILADMVEQGGNPGALAAARGFEAMDTDELETLVDRLIEEHPDEWARFCDGDDGDRKKMQGFFTGQIMKATHGQADGKAVAQLLGRKSA